VTEPGEQQAAAMLSRLQQQYNLRLQLIRRFDLGDDGAYLVEDYAGRRLVFKWRPWQEGAAEASRLTARRLARMRKRACPVQAQVAEGRIGESVFELQEFAEGRPVDEITEDMLRQLIDIVLMERGMGLGAGGDWWEFLADGLFRDRSPLCRPSVLDGCTGAVERLLTRLRKQALYVTTPKQQLPNDVVHFDFGPANLLAANGRITAVLDWQACRDGDASYDLVTTDWDLVAWPKAESRVGEQLRHEISRTTAPGAALIYAAHTVLRNLTWSYGTEWEDHVVRSGHEFLDRWETG
jgi:phosphotransferase family enzyme